MQLTNLTKKKKKKKKKNGRERKLTVVFIEQFLDERFLGQNQSLD